MRSLLNSKIDLCISKCFKNCFEYDDINDFIPLEIRDEEVDGILYLSFDDNSSLIFDKKNDFSSILITDNLNEYTNEMTKFKNLSFNEFWEKRINVKITKVKELYNENIIYGVRFYLINGCHFEICYYWETNYDFDTLVVREFIQ